MGFKFRNASYVRRVWLGKRTIKDGEAAVVWTLSGRSKTVVGPYRKRLYFSTIKFLDRYQASARQYLRVEHSDGRVEHLRGPCFAFEHPVTHRSMAVRDAITLDANEAVVVYDDAAQDDIGKTKVARRVLKGPAVFFPSPSERVAQFSWTSPLTSRVEPATRRTNKSGGRDLVALQSVVSAGSRPAAMGHKLSLLPEPHAFRVKSVQTQDSGSVDLLIGLHLQLFEPERMVDNTRDPVKDIFDSLSADVTAFCGSRTYKKVLEDTPGKLASSLPTVLHRAQANGFHVEGVQVVSCAGDDAMQHVHARRRELKLKLEADEAEQARLAISDRRAEQERAREAAAFALKLKLAADEHDQLIKHKTELQNVEMQWIRSLHGHDVDLTRLLTAKEYLAAVVASNGTVQVTMPGVEA